MDQNPESLSDAAVRVICFALEHAVGVAILAIAGFASGHVPPEHREELGKTLCVLDEARQRLQARHVQRWGSDNPFPKKWRDWSGDGPEC
jgi:hypothetical protein